MLLHLAGCYKLGEFKTHHLKKQLNELDLNDTQLQHCAMQNALVWLPSMGSLQPIPMSPHYRTHVAL